VHGQRKRKFNLLIDLQKAYDSVDRLILWKLLKKRCQSQQERSLVELIMKLHNNSTIQVGTHSMEAEMGLPQGSILSPVLFNVYLEEALKSSEKLEEVRRRGDLLAFADDMLVMSNNQHEVEMIVNELAKLTSNWNLRLNKKKSEILTSENLTEIGGVRCTKMVKYLGVKVTVDRKEQTKVAREQIEKNIRIMRWRLGRADSDVIQ
jgi:retron-type reverse transcriptase